MAAENEEFEFRLRAEKEAATPKPAAPAVTNTGSGSDLIPQGYAKPVKEESPPLITPAEIASGPGGLITAGGRAVGRGLEKILNTDVNLPVLGRGNLGQVLQGLGPAESMGPRAATPASASIKAVNRVERAAPAVKEAAPAGAGAEKAVNELQRQRNVAEGVEKPANLAGQGAHEAAVLERDKVTTPLRTAAFRDPSRVDAAPVEKLISDLEAKNPDPKVRAALKGVRDVITNATTASKNAGLPEAGARVTPADLKALQGQSKGMNHAMADEVRQSINRLLDKTGDGALDGHTKQLLTQIKEKLVEGTSPAYKKYLSEYGRLSKPLDEFAAAGSAGSKVTTEAAAFHLLDPADKQARLTNAFKSETPGRALTELVRDTQHNPEALQGVRTSYMEWLVDAGDATPKQLQSNWKATREATKSSKLLTPEHIANIDKAVAEIAEAQNADSGKIKKAWASTAGFVAGMAVGHPIVGAHAARDLATGASKTQKVEKAMEKALMAIAGEPEGAALLAAPPTPANIEKIRVMLPTDVAAVLAMPVATAERQPPRKSRNPLSMQPTF